MVRVVSVLCACLLVWSASSAQVVTTDLFNEGVRQLTAARSTRNDADYSAAEHTFSLVLRASANNAHALVYRGEARIMRGVLALQSSLQTATSFFETGTSDMDLAVALAPNDLSVRFTRGLAYAEFPDFYNKREVARQDLKIVLHDPHFPDLPERLRTRIMRALERVQPPSADNSSRVDRFPSVGPAISPILVVASVTFERVRPSETPDWLHQIMDALHQSPGMLGAHTATSFEHPGMFLIFTWWKNKQTLNEFFHGEVHQSWMRQRAPAVRTMDTTYFESGPSQVGIELFTPLPGGAPIGGRFTPHGVSVK